MGRVVTGRTLVVALCLQLLFPFAVNAEDFVVRDISIQGLQRISLGTALNYLPVKQGDIFTDKDTDETIRSLYKTGFFNDVKLYRQQDRLLILVEERPAIASVTISGNKQITEEQLKEGLKSAGIAENRIFNKSVLEQIEQEIRRQYVAQARYSVKIESRITTRERNRVDVAIVITEGHPARIARINISGNKSFTEATLLSQFELAPSGVGTVFGNADEYARQKLQGDLEKLRSWYLDRGYLKFEILSTQVSISPDREDIFITIVIKEGEQYTTNEVKLVGELIVDEQEMLELVEIHKGDTYSARKVTDTTTALTDRLGEEGYAFANVNMSPQVNEQDKTVDLTFFIDPGNRVYVRRINISGNTSTQDEVIRREMRQLEGSWFTPQLLRRSRERIQRLGYFKNVSIETPPVPGTTDQLDVNVKVEEGQFGQLQAGMGYGDPNGLILNANIAMNNFMGTGKRVSLKAEKDRYRKDLNFSYTNPYYTDSGVSRTLTMFYRHIDAERGGFGNYATNDKGGRINYGFPLSEYNTARLGLEAKHTDLTLDSDAPTRYHNWVNTYGESFTTLSLDMGWTHDNRNRTFMAESGFLQRLSAEVAIPGGDLEFYKLFHEQEWNWELADGWVFKAGSDIAYGAAFGDTEELPFFERFYAGGVRTVRGFANSSLGPRDIDTDEPVGGDARFVGTLELIFPLPFTENSRSFRASAFVDFGNAFMLNEKSRAQVVDDPDLEKLRSSYGLSLLWISPIGAFSFNWGWPINERKNDDTQVFQWFIGAPF